MRRVCKSIARIIIRQLIKFKNIVFQKKMLQATPSIQFELQDQQQISTINQVPLQFSKTILKDQNVGCSCEDEIQLKKILVFQNPYPKKVSPKLFYQQFDSKYIVSFDNEDEPIQEKINYPLSQPNAFVHTKQNIQLSCFNLSSTIESLQEKEIKSQIVTKKGLPSFKIKHRKLTKNKQNIMDNKPIPNTCRNNQNKGLLCFTSKATPQNFQMTKGLLNKYEKTSNKSLLKYNEKVRQLFLLKNPEKTIQSIASEMKKRKKQGRDNIFLKLPLIK